ncbi:MAG TPA: amidohydrolase family protein [Acidimicrobiales bacterium]|nr:amidohydrolase family protein [Acidimicrobiales bacterium]
MTYATRRIFDADSHIMETADWLASYADPAIRGRLRPYTTNATELLEHLDEALQLHARRQSDPDLLARAEDQVLIDKGWLSLGAFDPKERSRALDLLGFEQQLVFASFSLAQFFNHRDLDVVYGGATAHNRGMAEFCATDPRLLAVGYVPMEVPERAAATAEEAVSLGCRALHVKSHPSGSLSPSHPEFDRLWAVCQEAGVAVVAHLGGGNLPDGRRPLPEVFENNGKPPGSGFLGGEGMKALDYLATPHPVELFVGALVLDGVLERFPRLRVGVIEQGAMWLVPWMRRLDLAQKIFRKGQPYLELPMSASEYVRRQVRTTPFPREPVGWIIDQVGDEIVMFSSDYPHPEGGKDPVALWEGTFDGLSEESLEKFYWRNCADMLGLSVAA